MKNKPLCIDLCCGIGGWATPLLELGYCVIGFDVKRFPQGYPGQLILQDIHTIDGTRWLGKVRLFVASPPCERFSLYGMPFAHADKTYPPADLDLVNTCFRIAREAQAPIILENVRALQYFLGPAEYHLGSFYLWGDVPVLRPQGIRAVKGMHGDGSISKGTRCRKPEKLVNAPGTRSTRNYKWTNHRPSHLRAQIPVDLARWIGESYLPLNTPF